MASMGLGIPPLQIKIMLESNPPKSRTVVRRLAASPSLKGGSGKGDPDKYYGQFS